MRRLSRRPRMGKGRVCTGQAASGKKEVAAFVCRRHFGRHTHGAAHAGDGDRIRNLQSDRTCRARDHRDTNGLPPIRLDVRRPSLDRRESGHIDVSMQLLIIIPALLRPISVSCLRRHHGRFREGDKRLDSPLLHPAKKPVALLQSAPASLTGMVRSRGIPSRSFPVFLVCHSCMTSITSLSCK